MTARAGAIDLFPAFGLSALWMLRCPKGSPQRSEEQLQAHRAMPEGEASGLGGSQSWR
ncbi:hypothetical protein [Pontibacter chinhatensis]|uniref:Uncharacterized protein n=1 Tax=Pontibacter chinhatensis TaxID=1436961 RepID=A0A1I2WQU0_9BACT|nr:hypothetical protein [Pontibacter chinhatensis]SFH03703.1 hypothetical protein SAMN05421739_105158 [Pontibacter chinhatensis]